MHLFENLNSYRKPFFKQLRRYSETVLWLYKEIYIRYTKKTVVVQITHFIGPLLMGSSLGLLFLFAHRMEKNEPLAIKNIPFVFEPRNPTDFAIFIALIGSLLLLSAIIIFYAKYLSAKLSVQFALDKSKNAITIEGARPSTNSDPDQNPYPKDVLRCSKSILGMVRSINPLLQLFQSLFQFIFAFAAILYINTFLTLMILIVVFPSLYFQYRINYHAAKNEEKRPTLFRKMQSGITQLLNKYSKAPVISQSTFQSLDNAYLDDSITGLPEWYINRILASPKSQAVSTILIAILSVIIVSYLGIEALNGEITWAIMIGYIVFARTCMISLRGLMGTITGFARHYPRSRKNYELLSSWPGKNRLSENSIRIRRSRKKNPGDLKFINLRRGQILSVLSPVPITRYNSYAYSDALSTHKSVNQETLWGAMTLVPNAIYSCPGFNLKELLNLQFDSSLTTVKEAAKKLGLDIDINPIDLDTSFSLDNWVSIPVEIRCNLLLEHVKNTQGDVILMENVVLEGAQDWYRINWWKKVTNRFLVIRHDDADTLGRLNEVAVMGLRLDRETVLMSKDWAVNNFKLLGTWFENANIKQSDDEELDDDDE